MYSINWRKYAAVLIQVSLQILLLTAATINVRAQDPVLPATNLGLANFFDGVAGKPGLFFQTYIQDFQTHALYGPGGQKTPSDLKINSLLSMNQLLYLSPVKVLGGNLGFTVLIPVVQVHSSGLSGPAPTANPGVLGDPLIGTAVQWSGRKLFGKSFSHRLEFDVNVPVGNFDSRYQINPSAHLWNYETYYAFTIILDKQLSISSRNQVNYNAHFLGTTDKAGAFYNGNYSIEYSLLPAFKIEAVAYYLKQLDQDSHDGDHHYYQDQYGIADTKEQVLAYGPGIVYISPGGTLFEAKMFFESDAQNRFAGSRPTLRIVVPLSK